MNKNKRTSLHGLSERLAPLFLHLVAYMMSAYAGGVSFLGLSALIEGEQASESFFDVFVFTLQVGVLVAVVAAIPSLIFILVARRFQLRSVWVFCLLGGATAMICVAVIAGPTAWRASTLGFLAVMFLAGAVAGAVYWLIAVRRSQRG